ncbi:MAG: hypothetical protein C0467_01835 [Planctomycetaceae bacterium]|nr:hypothetical protein [Planctomycetaceae bacterium]
MNAARALAIRRVIGRCGSVESEFIHHDDRWPEELGVLDFWDSIDYLGFVLDLERELKLRKPVGNWEFQTWYYSGFVVSELVQRLLRLIEATPTES